MLAQHRQVPTPTALKALVDWRWIELARQREVERDALCRMGQAAADESPADGLGMIALFALSQRATGTAEASTKQGIGHSGLVGEGRDTSHLCRCSPSFLNLRVQVGTLHPASGFPLEADMHNGRILGVPGVRIRLKKIPRPLPYTAGDV